MIKSEIAMLYRGSHTDPVPDDVMIVRPGCAHVIVNTDVPTGRHIDVYSMPESEWRQMLKYWQERPDA